MKYTTLIFFGSILIILLHSCSVANQTQTKTTYSENLYYGKFQRCHQWNAAYQTNEILTINRDGTFSIRIKATSNGIDTGYYCKGMYWMSVDSKKSLSCIVLQTQDAHNRPSIDRIAYPVDGSIDRITLWNSHDVCMCIHGCDTLFETSNAVPYVRIQAYEVWNSGCTRNTKCAK